MPYILNFEYCTDETTPSFRIFFTTKRLLAHIVDSKNVNSDGTYKCIWQGYPVLLVGCTDMQKVFYPTGLGITTQECEDDFAFLFNSLKLGVEKVSEKEFLPKVLIADSAAAISNAFSQIFQYETIRVNCWAHCIRAYEKKLCLIEDNNLKLSIGKDIEQLQLAKSNKEFEKASELWLKKWSNESCRKFVEYFTMEWLTKSSGWYEGIAPLNPSTNNGLEATNKWIKDENTLRERLPVSQFLKCAEEIVSNWSQERNPASCNFKNFSLTPSLNLPLMTNGYHFMKQNRVILLRKSGNTIFYYVNSTGFESVSDKCINSYVSYHKRFNWATFNQYVKCVSSLWCITFDEENWRNSSCTCPYYLKNFLCKHVVGIAMRLKFCDIPTYVKNIQLGQKRKRGRPSKVKASLIFE